jgi:hypothetical protein
LTCCRAAAAAGDQLALVEFAAAEQTITALSLNGMKLGDSHAIQVGKQKLQCAARHMLAWLCVTYCCKAGCGVQGVSVAAAACAVAVDDIERCAELVGAARPYFCTLSVRTVIALLLRPMVKAGADGCRHISLQNALSLLFSRLISIQINCLPACGGPFCCYLCVQVVKAPAISMAEMLQVNPMAAIHMQHIQQQQAALLHSQALLAQLRANAGLTADGTVPAAVTAAAAAAKEKERGDRSRSRSRGRSGARSRSRSPPAFVKERQRARERQIEKADR